jgi:ankyrin repeat protein
MSDAPDFRSLRMYNRLEFNDREFIYDTLRARITQTRKRKTKDFVLTLTQHLRAMCGSTTALASAAADILCDFVGSAHNYAYANFTQILHLARICGCAKDPSREENGLFSTHESKEYSSLDALRSSLQAWLKSEFEKVEKVREELILDTGKHIQYASFAYVLEKDSAGLDEFLAQLEPNSGNLGCDWGMPTLEDVLLCTDSDGWTSLQRAAETSDHHCISVILRHAQRTYQGVPSVLRAGEYSDDVPAVFRSVYNADVECILAFLHGGADFSTACGGSGVSILEYLVHLASSGLHGSTYFPILEVVLKYMLEKNPNLDLTAPISYKKPEEIEVVVDSLLTAAATVVERECNGATANSGSDDVVVDEDNNNAVGEDLVDPPQEEQPGETSGSRPGRRGRRDDPYAYDPEYDDYGGGYGDYRRRNYGDELDTRMHIPGFCGMFRTGATPDEQMDFGWISDERKKNHIARHELRHDQEWEDASWTLLSIAVEHVALGVVKLLLDAGADPNYRLPARSGGGGGGVVAILCYALDKHYTDGWNPVACEAVMKLLLDSGADINAVHPDTKNTALIEAARNHEPEILVFLLKNGADQTPKNAKGQTAQMEAERYSPDLAELMEREARLQRLVQVVASDTAPQNRENENSSSRNIASDVAGDVDETEEIPEEMRCGICWENEKSITLAPCGHQRLCAPCALKVLSCISSERKCPFCKTSIESYITKIYD